MRIDDTNRIFGFRFQSVSTSFVLIATFQLAQIKFMRCEKNRFPTLPEGTRVRDSLARAYFFHFSAKFNVALLEVQNLLSGQLLAAVRFSL